jgi:hypothetical protein
MSLALKIAIGWTIAIVIVIALWNLGFILAERRQRALEARGARAARPEAGGRRARARTRRRPAA